jgi:hypothetical protein
MVRDIEERERTPAKENWCLLYLCFCWFVFNREIYYKGLRSQEQSGLKCIHAGVINYTVSPYVQVIKNLKIQKRMWVYISMEKFKTVDSGFQYTKIYIHAGSNLCMACTHR